LDPNIQADEMTVYRPQARATKI